MTPDDIIRMAQESKLLTTTAKGYQVWIPENLEAFAALVAAAEREAILKKADSLGWVSVDHIRERGQT